MRKILGKKDPAQSYIGTFSIYLIKMRLLIKFTEFMEHICCFDIFKSDILIQLEG